MRSFRIVAAATCLFIPCVAILMVPYFNRLEPRIFGLPFFYGYQLLWVPLSAGFIALADRLYAPVSDDRA